LSNIRVTYSGLIAFIVSLSTFITGSVFVIIVTRRLTPDELGLWTLIGSIVSYVIIIEPIISYWSTRQIARGEKVGKTAVTTGGLFSIGGFIVYSGIAIFVSASIGADLSILILASALVPLTFLNNILQGICLSYKPQIISYGIFTFEVSKIPFGFYFVAFLELGIVGALIATILATLLKTMILTIYAREQLHGKIKKDSIKFWLRMSWLPLYLGSSGLLWKLDVLIFSLQTNSLVGLAYWGVSQAAGNLVSHSSNISQALYPKLLATGKKEIAEENLKRYFYFGLPLLAGAIVFAKPALYILNPIYVDGVMIVYFIAIRSFLDPLRAICYNIMAAYEKIDLDKTATFKQYVKSKLFLVPTLNYIHSGAYVALLIAFLLIFWSSDVPDVESVTIWSIIVVVTTIPFLIYGLIMIYKEYEIILPYKSIIKYFGITLLASLITYYLIENSLTYKESIFDFIPQLLPYVILAGAIYLSLTYAIDEPTRKLVKLILSEFKK